MGFAALFPGCRDSSRRHSPPVVSFWIGNLPYTSDPLAGNEIAHGILSGAVHIGLVSDARKGAIQGRLAESWTASPDMRTWTFYLRSDLKFDNGDPITPEILRLSWERAFRRLSGGGSRGGVFWRLASPPRASHGTKLPGVSFQTASVTMSFKEPYPTLLGELSEPLYSVVHPSCISADPDDWSCRANPVTSGAYRIIAHSDQRIELALRTDFPKEFLHPRPLARVAFTSAEADRDSASMVFGLSADRLEGSGLRFQGGAVSGVVFGRCQSWSLTGTPCHSKSDRIALRERLYAELEHRGLSPVRSFFPLALPSVSQFSPQAIPAVATGTKTVSVAPIAGRFEFLTELGDAAKSAVEGLGWEYRMVDSSGRERFQELEPGRKTYKNDLVFFLTELTLSQVEDSVRYMFQSKQGARLPDLTGRVPSELSKTPLDLQRINGILWEDAVIWPIAHVGFGTWARDEFDFSLANTGLVAVPLPLVGWEH